MLDETLKQASRIYHCRRRTWHDHARRLRRGDIDQMNRPLSLSDHQLAEVKRATHSLPPSKRTHFLEELAKRLGAEPTNQALHEAISIQLQLSLSRVPAFLCDALTVKEKSK